MGKKKRIMRKRCGKHQPSSFSADGIYFPEKGFVEIPGIGRMRCEVNDEIPIGKDKKFINARVICEHGKWSLCFDYECDEPQTN